MTRLVIDVENSVTRNGRAIDNRPHNVNNSLVSIGIFDVDTEEVDYVFVHHNDRQDGAEAFDRISRKIKQAKQVIFHNAKYDIQWLWSVGIEFDGDVYDTMIGEYLLARGKRVSISLKNSCERRQLQQLKSDITEQYWNDGIGFEAMPAHIVEEYGIADIKATGGLYLAQAEDYVGHPLQRTLTLTNKMALCLAQIEYHGLKIDADVLSEVELDYRTEQIAIESRLKEIVYDVMGDKPYNLSSPEQLSQILFSRIPKNKKIHHQTFELDRPFRPRMPSARFNAYLKSNCWPVYKRTALFCKACKGTGKVHRTKKDGTFYARASTCKECGGAGMLYPSTKEIAGFKINPPDATWATAGGFSTDKNKLRNIAARLKAKVANKPNQRIDLAIEFITKVERLGAIETYLNSFVDGIKKRLINNVLRAEFNQCRTATGRLSSSSPNLQNMPRGDTFPVKRAFVSHFKNGSLIEFDFAQLEFRCAAFLADDETAKHEIETGFDVHTYTANYLTEHGQPTTRQEAKGRTFAPLYGSVSGTTAERAYNLHFTDKYQGIKRWHQELQDCAIRKGMVVLPSGREFDFSGTTRTRTGGATNATKIKNYPVQSFATADLVQLCIVHLFENLSKNGLVSRIVNTVHDSVLIDCPPEEVSQVSDLIDELLSTDSINQLIQDFYDIKMTVPLEIEQKKGSNWLEMS